VAFSMTIYYKFAVESAYERNLKSQSSFVLAKLQATKLLVSPALCTWLYRVNGA